MFLKQSNSRRSFRLSLGGSHLSGCFCLLAGLAGLVAVTSIVALLSKKSPLNASTQSVTDLVNQVFQSAYRTWKTVRFVFPTGGVPFQ